MWKIAFFLFIFLLFHPIFSSGSQPTFVSLWQSENKIVQSILPADWKSLNSEEIERLTAVIPENIITQSGKIVSGFKLPSEITTKDSLHNPLIIVFVKSGEKVSRDMIQKTYVWLQNNQNLVTNVLPGKVDSVGIQNIEYNQNLPAILFQNRIPVKDHHFTGMSSIIFLKNNILNIVCLTDEKRFAEYQTIFQSFIESVVVPKSLRHAAAFNSKTKATPVNEIFGLLNDNWQPILGISIILVIYAFVFRTGREKI